MIVRLRSEIVVTLISELMFNNDETYKQKNRLKFCSQRAATSLLYAVCVQFEYFSSGLAARSIIKFNQERIMPVIARRDARFTSEIKSLVSLASYIKEKRVSMIYRPAHAVWGVRPRGFNAIPLHIFHPKFCALIHTFLTFTSPNTFTHTKHAPRINAKGSNFLFRSKSIRLTTIST